MMDGDFSLSSLDETKRRFWIEHGKRCLEIAGAFAQGHRTTLHGEFLDAGRIQRHLRGYR